MLFYPAAPGIHAILKVAGKQGDDAVHQFAVFFVTVYSPFPTDREFSALQHPGQQTGVDAVFHCLCGLVRDAAQTTGFVHHFQEQAAGIGHLHAGRVHFRMDDACFSVDGELGLVLGIG